MGEIVTGKASEWQEQEAGMIGRKLLHVGLFVALICVTAFRLGAAYRTFSGTWDEPLHVAAGMEWLDRGTYSHGREQPPLARVFMALGPYLKGLRWEQRPSGTDEGNAILLQDGAYRENLTLARYGNLPFLILASLMVFLWARRWFAGPAAMVAIVLFLGLPPVMGHAALATTDVACMGSFMTALYFLLRWLEERSVRHAMLFGAALGFSFLIKFVNVAFFVVCVVAGGIYYVFTKSLAERPVLKPVLQRTFAQLGAALGIMLMVLWAGYRFSMEPLASPRGPHPATRFLADISPSARDIADRLLETPIPLAKAIRAMREMCLHGQAGHASYLLGEYRETGWWYFYPVVVAVKTPIGFLVLSLSGLAMIGGRLRSHSWQQCVTALFPLAVFVFCLTSRIDLGVRHILAIYPFLAVMAGCAVGRAFQRGGVRRALAGLMVVMALTESAIAHPDYLASFNVLAGRHPENILAESDLDWGQDLNRLGARLRELGVKEVSIAYFGTAPLETAGLPDYSLLPPNQAVSGWVAVSVRNLTLEYAKNGANGWLREHKPFERIGKSIYLYKIE